MFYGEKLSSLRELNGLSRKDLATRLNVTEQAVWQYENDATLPKIEVMNQLRTIFNVETKYFFTRNYLASEVSEERVAYRTTDRESRKKTKLEVTYLNYIDYYIRYLEQNLIIPEAKINQLIQACQLILNNSNQSRSALIQQVAAYARAELGLQHNRDLMYVLEKSGIYILEKNLGMQIDAYSTITKAQRPYIVLGTFKKSAVRRNFDIAHELGHLLLHRTVDMSILTPAELKAIEKEAHLFASAFLLPEANFKVDFQKLRRKSNPDFYIDLKRKYLVSLTALEMRAYGLGLMSYQENRYFWGQLTKKDYKVNEPLDDEIPPIKPGKIRSLFKFVLDHQVIQLADLLGNFNILPEFLSQLFNLDEHFFDQYLKPQQDYFSQAVIDLDSFRQKPLSE